MKRTSCGAIALVGAFVLAMFFVGARENPDVSQIAHDGYWLKDQKDDYDAAMAMLDKPAPPLQLTDWRGTR